MIATYFFTMRKWLLGTSSWTKEDQWLTTKVPNFTTPELGFEIGKGILLQPGSDVTVVATGHLVWEALEAAKELISEGISVEVINIHTIKPLDEEIILNSLICDNIWGMKFFIL